MVPPQELLQTLLGFDSVSSLPWQIFWFPRGKPNLLNSHCSGLALSGPGELPTKATLSLSFLDGHMRVKSVTRDLWPKTGAVQ